VVVLDTAQVLAAGIPLWRTQSNAIVTDRDIPAHMIVTIHDIESSMPIGVFADRHEGIREYWTRWPPQVVQASEILDTRGRGETPANFFDVSLIRTMRVGDRYNALEEAYRLIASAGTRSVTQAFTIRGGGESYVVVTGLTVGPITMGPHVCMADVLLLELVVGQASAIRKSRVGICVEAIKNIQACLDVRSFEPIEGSSDLLAGVAACPHQFIAACSRVFHSLTAHAHMLYRMLDHSGWTRSICARKRVPSERMSGELDAVGAREGDDEINTDTADLRYDDDSEDEEIALPQLRGEIPANEAAEATASPATPHAGDSIPRSPWRLC
jgi:hypothetical protein